MSSSAKLTNSEEVAPGEGTRVWDPLVRHFHWSVVNCCLGAFLFERPRDRREVIGLIVSGTVAIRVVWGFIGTRHARFTDFVPGPGARRGLTRPAAATDDVCAIA